MIPGSGNIALSTDAANIMTSSMGTVQNGVSNSEVVSAIKDLKNNMTGIKSLIGKKFDWIK